jgi:hypothetical protein
VEICETLMELLDRLTQSLTARGRLLKELAAITGRMQGLVDRLQRHGAACMYPQMKAGIEQATEGVRTHAKALNNILSSNRVWAKLAGRTGHEGINNWERISGDLGVLAQINVELNQLAVGWTAVDADIADQLRTMVGEQVRLIDVLQEIAARSDPQAID